MSRQHKCAVAVAAAAAADDGYTRHSCHSVCVVLSVRNDDDDRNDFNPVPLAHIALYLCVEHLVFFVPFIFNICFLCSALMVSFE